MHQSGILFSLEHSGFLTLIGVNGLSSGKGVSMFSFKSLRRFLPRGAFVLLVCLAAAGMFAGCSTDNNSGETGNLDGTWENIYDDGEYHIVTTIIINTAAKTVEYEGSYEGNIANSPAFDRENGVLIVEFTKYADWGDPEPLASHGNVGKFGALYWTDLTADSVKLADAYEGYVQAMYDTIEEAQSAFTPAADKAGNFVTWSVVSPYTKK